MNESLALVKLADIRIDGGTQPRAAIDEQIVREYAEFMAAGVALPAIDLFYDGVTYWLADGFHRFHAARSCERERIEAIVRDGTRRDAVLFSVAANQEHGLRRTNADKRKAVLTLLNDEEWSTWGDREIGRRCGVHHVTVGKLRRESSLVKFTSENSPRTYTTKHGTEATMKTAHIGKRPGSKEAARVADLETRTSAAIKGASQAVLRRLPRKDDVAIVNNTVHLLRGVMSAFGSVDPAALSGHPQAETWRAVVADTIAMLRAFNRRLERRAV